VRAFVRDNLPRDISRKVLEHRRLHRDDIVRWQDILAVKGWLAGHWPEEFGGCGWTPVHAHIFDEEPRRWAHRLWFRRVSPWSRR